MATRAETRQRREELKAHLREANRLAAGTPRAAATVRELAAQFSLSVNSVLDAQRELVSEGALRSVPRVGTFIGRPGNGEHLFLMVHGSTGHFDEFNQRLSLEFQDRLALLGGAALTLEVDVALSLMQSGALPPLSGVFDVSPRSERVAGATRWSEVRPDEVLPRVRYANSTREECDSLAFDDEGGGYAATQHLLQLGCERIAFLGLIEQPRVDGLFEWSRERESGWRRALSEARREWSGLACYPSNLGSLDAGANEVDDEPIEIEAGRWMAHEIAQLGDIDGIVAANDPVAHGFLNGLQSLQVPVERWPAIVGFDADPRFSGQFLTSLRLPWEEIGRSAANILWARANGMTQGPAQSQRVAMKLIPRLSCRTHWLHPATQSALFKGAMASSV